MEYIEANIDYKILGERIKNARKEKKLSQEKMSELIEVAPTYISRIETGKSRVNLKRLAQISKLLDVSMSELLTGTSPDNEQYLDKELSKIIKQCSPDKQRLIYNIAKIISELKIE